jgi:hypothetical protein
MLRRFGHLGATAVLLRRLRERPVDLGLLALDPLSIAIERLESSEEQVELLPRHALAPVLALARLGQRQLQLVVAGDQLRRQGEHLVGVTAVEPLAQHVERGAPLRSHRASGRAHARANKTTDAIGVKGHAGDSRRPRAALYPARRAGCPGAHSSAARVAEGSSPSSSMANSCASFSTRAAPSVTRSGSAKRPRSSLLCTIVNPPRVKTKSFICERRRFKNRKTCPEMGAAERAERTSFDSPSKDLRRFAGAVAT